MGVRLTDLQQQGRSEKCNWWNWRPTMVLLQASGVLDDVQLVTLDLGVGEVSGEQARLIARFLDEQVLPAVQPGERIKLDGTITAVPDDGTFYREPSEQSENYSASEEWLRRFAAFCRVCGGFRVQ